MVILGIDPGINITGYAVVHIIEGRCILKDKGFIKPPKTNAFSKRLSFLYTEFLTILKRLKPDVVVVEEIYSHVGYPYTAVLMGHARGVLFLAVELLNCKLATFSATQIKKAIVGKGRASKEQVRTMLKNLYGLSEEIETLPLDVSDALALATGYVFYRARDRRIMIQ